MNEGAGQITQQFISLCTNVLPKAIGAGILGTLQFLLGEDAGLIGTALVIMVICDTVLGIAISITNGGKFELAKSFKGMYKLLLYMVLLIASHQISLLIPEFLYLPPYIGAYIATHVYVAVHIKADKLGLPMPKKISELAQKYFNE